MLVVSISGYWIICAAVLEDPHQMVIKARSGTVNITDAGWIGCVYMI
jgi:hypothetical protein